MSATLGILFAILFEPMGSVGEGPRAPSPQETAGGETVGQETVGPAEWRQTPDRIDDAPPDAMGPGAQIIIRERIIIRVPSRRPTAERPVVDADREPAGRGPRCIPVAPIRSAMASGDGALLVDLGRRGLYWAGLGRGCRSMDFHGGIYIAPAADGLFCAGRDMLRARSGASCMISRFVDLP